MQQAVRAVSGMNAVETMSTQGDGFEVYKKHTKRRHIWAKIEHADAVNKEPMLGRDVPGDGELLRAWESGLCKATAFAASVGMHISLEDDDKLKQLFAASNLAKDAYDAYGDRHDDDDDAPNDVQAEESEELMAAARAALDAVEDEEDDEVDNGGDK